MFTDPTLYGATFPHREFSFMNPYFAQWQYQQPYHAMYGQQQFPWFMQQGKQFVPQHEFYPQVQQPFFGHRFFGQFPYNAPFAQGIYNLPQYKWQPPFVY